VERVPVGVWTIVIVAPASGLPLTSATVPRSAEVVSCAIAVGTTTKVNKLTSKVVASFLRSMKVNS
jgi:hypothetical protein